MPRTTYFAAVDHDCDGLFTTIYRVRTDREITTDTCPDDVFPLLRQGYFGASDLFTMPGDVAEAAARRHGCGWHTFDGVATATFKGSVAF